MASEQASKEYQQIFWAISVPGCIYSECDPEEGLMEQHTTSTTTALGTQVGGSHYKDMKIQPIEYCQLNRLGYCESNVVKYVSRWRQKNGVEDLKKAKHCLDLLIELEERGADD